MTTLPDLSTHVAGWLGLTVAELGTYLLTIVVAAPLISAARPYVEPVLVRWRDAAALTRTTADDNAARLVTLVWSALVLVPLIPLRLFPIFTAAIEAAESEKARRETRRHHSGTVPCPLCLSYETVVACSMCAGTGGIPDDGAVLSVPGAKARRP